MPIDAIAGAVNDIAQVLAMIVAGYWTWSKFVRQREDKSKIDATADLEIIGEHLGSRLAVVTANVHNAGLVRHHITGMTFDLRVIDQDQELKCLEKALGHVDFPKKLYSAQRFFPKEWIWTFVEPGATNSYRYSIVLPLEVKFALVKVKVILPGDDEFFSSWKVFNVDKNRAIDCTRREDETAGARDGSGRSESHDARALLESRRGDPPRTDWEGALDVPMRPNLRGKVQSARQRD